MQLFRLSKNQLDDIEKQLELLGVTRLSPDEQIIVLDEISKYVFDINQRHSTKEKVFDLELDYKYYFCDFFNMGINLNKDEVDWWEFDNLLEGIFLNENSITNKMLSYRLYEKPSKNHKAQEEKEHKFRMQMKRKYALPSQINSNKGYDKLWNYLEKKVGDNKEC